ncbi:MAG: hypothetical protein MZW92_11820 [Comamonadaceae bacterium]|nr:hypothetical protein [Comamonadaceae bacterium]
MRDAVRACRWRRRARIAPAVMVNLLGDLWFDADAAREPDWATLLAEPRLQAAPVRQAPRARPGARWATSR